MRSPGEGLRMRRRKHRLYSKRSCTTTCLITTTRALRIPPRLSFRAGTTSSGYMRIRELRKSMPSPRRLLLSTRALSSGNMSLVRSISPIPLLRSFFNTLCAEHLTMAACGRGRMAALQLLPKCTRSW